jgi:hypothetical protein
MLAQELVTMSAKEVDRLEVIRRMLERRLKRVKAAQILGITARQIRRLCDAQERDGAAGLVTDLASEMQRRGRFGRRLVTPESREIRYRIMMPFRRALRAVLGKEEVERLVETIPGVGLRLNVPPRDCRILEPMNTASR